MSSRPALAETASSDAFMTTEEGILSAEKCMRSPKQGEHAAPAVISVGEHAKNTRAEVASLRAVTTDLESVSESSGRY
jgi:hypothetical protein